MRPADIAARMEVLIAQDPALAADAPSLARRIRAEVGVISDVDLLTAMRGVKNDTSGLGRLEPLLRLPGITDVVVNGPDAVFFDRGQGLEKSDIRFDSPAELRRLATRCVVSAGGRLDDSVPCADAAFARPDGTTVRLHAVLSPPAQVGPCVSLRVLRGTTITLDDLVRRGSITPETADLLRRIIARRLSFLVVGGTGSGKTTLLAALLSLVPGNQRIVIIEDTPELDPHHQHVVKLTTARANAEGRGEITMSELVRQSLRMRPDRLVVGEIRGAEVVDLLAALNTGHEGGAGTVHANSLAEVPARMEALAALGGLGRAALHTQLAAAVSVVVVTRRRGTTRELSQIGILRGDPVRAHVAWDIDAGPGPAFDQLQAMLS